MKSFSKSNLKPSLSYLLFFLTLDYAVDLRKPKSEFISAKING